MASIGSTIPDRTLRGALLGCGSITPFHLKAWAQIQEVDIVALANRTISKAQALSEEFGVAPDHVYSDYRKLLGNVDLDFVDIATAPHIHREQVLAAAEHGRHVLCQKPFATSLNEAQEMIGACEKAGVRCVVNENWRWRSWYRELKAMLAQGTIGKPRYARFQFRSDALLPQPNGERPPVLTTQAYLAEMPRLVVHEWGVHLLDVLRFLFGDVHSVYARMGWHSPFVVGEDTVLMTLQFQSGLVALVDISWVTHISDEQRPARGCLEPMVIEGDGGTLALDPYQGDVFTITTAAGVQRWPAHPGLTRAEAYQASYVDTQQHFVDCLLSGEPAENEARDNLGSLATAFAAYESEEHNRVILMGDYDRP
jgi:predicted dehydrogenase